MRVQSLERSDASKCAAIRIASLGSLVIGRPPPYPWYLELQIASIQNDLDWKPSVHHLKVVDGDGRDIVADAKWGMYPSGRSDLDQLSQPLDEESKTVDQYGALREAVHEYFCTRNDGEMGSRPHLRWSFCLFMINSDNLLVLALLVTSEAHRGRDAGSSLVCWGIAKSEESGLPCYLQASGQGRRLYKHHGFNDLDTVEFDLSKYGLPGVEKMTELVRKPSNAVDCPQMTQNMALPDTSALGRPPM